MRARWARPGRATELLRTLAVGVLVLCARAQPAYPLPTFGQAAYESGEIVEAPALARIELEACPPRCAASTYERAHPSDLYEPVEPDDWVFDGASQVIWGASEEDFWLIWGGNASVVWDDSMWVEPFISRLGSAAARVSSGPVYPSSKDPEVARPLSLAGARSRGRRVAVTSYQLALLGEEEKPELELPDAPPNEIWVPSSRNRLVTLLEQLSKSRYAVAGLTLGLVWLMARLAR